MTSQIEMTATRPERFTATEFKAKCLEILDRLAAREIAAAVITKRGRPVAIVAPPPVAADAADRLHGWMAGEAQIPPGLDLTRPLAGRQGAERR
ncbi:MAG: hypothetical protein ACRED8_03215 [Caulobacteraceae bacterium]